MQLQVMVGYKLFKKIDDKIHMVRITKVHRSYEDKGKDPAEITVYDYDTKETKKIPVVSLEGYTPLEPDGVLSFNVVTVKDENSISKDVMVTASKFLNMKFGDTMPYAVCRQSITDIFQNLVASNEDKMMVGVAVNQDDCPANFDFRTMLIASEIIHSDIVNFYRTDTLDELLDYVKINKYNEVLNDLYERYANSSNCKDPTAIMKQESAGWCRNLKLLLKQNNFQCDMDEMLGVSYLDFELAPHLIKKELRENSAVLYDALDDDMVLWLGYQHNIHINTTAAIEYDHDINLADFNNTSYFLLRDKSKKLYLVTYTVDGEFKESELEAIRNKPDFTTKYKVLFYNKHNKTNNK